MLRLLRLGLVLVLVVAAAIVLGTGVGMPPEVAAHFDRNGVASGTTPRGVYLAMILALVIGVPLLTAAMAGRGSGFVRPRLQVPHRDYWLDPSRRTATDDFVAGHACVLAIMLACFLTGMHLLTVQANGRVPPHLPEGAFAWVIGVFLAGFAAWIAAFFLRFRLPRGGTAPGSG